MLITDTTSMRIEVLRRETVGRMHWHFRQPELSLFWFAKGAERLRATIDGRSVNCTFPGKSRLAIFPAAIEIEGEWNVGPTLARQVNVMKLRELLRRQCRAEVRVTLPNDASGHIA